MRKIDRLRLKFIIYNVLIMTAVVGMAFYVMISVVKRRVNNQGNLALSKVVTGGEQSLVFAIMSLARIPFFTTLVGEDGAATLGEGYDTYWEPRYLEQTAVLGMTGEEDMGIPDAYHLRYLGISQPASHMIAFADIIYEGSLRNGVMRHGAMACVAIWPGLFALSYFFSRWTVKPMEESVHIQRQSVTNASHELRTSLAIITANVGLLQEWYASMSTRADKWMEHVSQECGKVRSLVESLLFPARNDSHVPEKGEFTRFGLSDLVMEKIPIFKPMLYQEEKTLEYKIEGDTMTTDSLSQMEQLTKALMDNAAKYSVPRGRTGARLEPVGRNRTRLWVCSQGEPISEDRRTLIFRRSHRDDSARSSISDYGLGLVIAVETAKDHEAGAGVEHRDGMNCFYVTMRRERA